MEGKRGDREGGQSGGGAEWVIYGCTTGEKGVCGLGSWMRVTPLFLSISSPFFWGPFFCFWGSCFFRSLWAAGVRREMGAKDETERVRGEGNIADERFAVKKREQWSSEGGEDGTGGTNPNNAYLRGGGEWTGPEGRT